MPALRASVTRSSQCLRDEGRWIVGIGVFFFFSSRRRHTRLQGDWSSDVCSSDLLPQHLFESLCIDHLQRHGASKKSITRAFDDDVEFQERMAEHIRYMVETIGDRKSVV